eukprot:12863820-Heterocapsa_arctica.AAC.1
MLLRLRIGLSSSDFVQHYQPSTRNLMVIAKMPKTGQKPSTTLKNSKQPSKSYTPVCVHL